MNLAKTFKKLPNQPGIYLFYNNQKELIYIGKATNLKSRVRSYFIGTKTSRPIEQFIDQIEDIQWQTTDSVLEAIILEANQIKKYLPKFNVLGKDNKSWNYLIITNEPFPQLKTIRQHELDAKKIPKTLIFKTTDLYGPYPGINTLATLKLLRQLFTYSTCQPHQAKPCFYHQIHQCLGVCTGEITSADYKRKVISPLRLFLKGKKKKLIGRLEILMRLESKSQNYEEAARLRNQIFNLKKIHDVTLINQSFFNDSSVTLRLSKGDMFTRIEGYDISNLGSTGIVGSLVVFEHNEPKKSDYRKFKIRTVQSQSDVDSLAEIISRRIKRLDWPLPNLFLIDGGKPQINRVRQILAKNKITVPVIGIAKGALRKKNEFHVPREMGNIPPSLTETLIQVRDEAHRFAIKYQRQLRQISS